MQSYEENGVPMERWKVGASTYETCLTRGARLLRWKLDVPTGRREILFWPEGAPMDLDKIGPVRGGNPILFPFMGRNYADGEKFAWKAADGVKRPMPQHGTPFIGKEMINQFLDWIETLECGIDLMDESVFTCPT